MINTTSLGDHAPSNVVPYDSLEHGIELQECWGELQRRVSECNYYQSENWYLTVVRHPDLLAGTPYFLVNKTDGEAASILPLEAYGRTKALFSLRYLQALGNLYSPYRSGPFEPQSLQSDARAIADYLLSVVDWDLLRLPDTPGQGSLEGALAVELGRRGAPIRRTQAEGGMLSYLDPEDSTDKYFRSLSPNLQQTIRRTTNRLNRDWHAYPVVVRGAHPT